MTQLQMPYSGRGVTAVLGPTNTGKTHLAIERMIAHKSGVIGLPLRLLAREVYQRVAARIGSDSVSLITGEERIEPKGARFLVCTVEAMPEVTDAEFVAIDEVQIATDLERGHVFTDRILNLRGQSETMLLGADTMRGVLADLLPGLTIITRPRMSLLTFEGSRKITRMPSRTAIAAFSFNEVYAIAELVRREKGGAAVVMGSLSPRTRNAQVELYEAGDVDYLVATDAIGMGLNLNVNHVAFAGDSKFDGTQFRKLKAAELAQIAGRAGRHTKDGTFGTTTRVAPFPDELIQSLESHVFEPDKVLTWRNRKLEFSSLGELKQSLEVQPVNPMLMRAPKSLDVQSLEVMSRDSEIADIAQNEDSVRLLWDVAKTPDYRKISPAAHTEILQRIFLDISHHDRIDPAWVEGQLKQCDRTKGEIDALSQRIANVRTWTYLTHRSEWLDDASKWQALAREIEDRLSDALHKALTRRFIDRRTSALMKGLKENRMLEAEVSKDGAVAVEGHHVGHLKGFRFVSDPSGSGKDAKAMQAAAAKALSQEIEKRAGRLAAAANSDIVLDMEGNLRWEGEPIARLTAGETPLQPAHLLLADEQLNGEPREKVSARLARWISNHINTLLKPLSDLSNDTELPASARGLAFQIVENLGIIARRDVAGEVKQLDQDVRAKLRRHGVKFGAYHIFVPALLKPAPTELVSLLWAIKEGKLSAAGRTEVPQLSAAGRTSMPVDPTYDSMFYRIAGFRVLGSKAVRVDILERLADLIRPALSWSGDGSNQKPEGAFDGKSFFVTPAMMSILGATHEDMRIVLKELGYKEERRPEVEVHPELLDSGSTEVTAAGDKENLRSGDVEPANEVPSEKPSDAHVSEQEDEGPVLNSLWRYGRDQTARRENQKSNRNRKPGSKDSGMDVRRTGKSARRHSGRKPDVPDADSPFAKLAALKEELASRK